MSDTNSFQSKDSQDHVNVIFDKIFNFIGFSREAGLTHSFRSCRLTQYIFFPDVCMANVKLLQNSIV